MSAATEALLAALPPAHPWFAIEPEAHGVLRIWEPHGSRLLRANAFLVRGRDRHLVIDAGLGIADLRAFLAPRLDRPVTLVLTHAHADHVGSAAAFAAAGDEVLIHAAEAALVETPQPDRTLAFDDYPEDRRARLRAAGFEPSGPVIAALPPGGLDAARWRAAPVHPTRLLTGGETIDLGDRRFEVIALPGHSPGSIGLWEAATGTLFGGDALYDGLIVDTLPESDPAAYRETMRRIRALAPARLHGGHRESVAPARIATLIRHYLSRPAGQDHHHDHAERGNDP